MPHRSPSPSLHDSTSIRYYSDLVVVVGIIVKLFTLSMNQRLIKRMFLSSTTCTVVKSTVDLSFYRLYLYFMYLYDHLNDRGHSI